LVGSTTKIASSAGSAAGSASPSNKRAFLSRFTVVVVRLRAAVVIVVVAEQACLELNAID